jgi:hypothetical protein
MAWGDILTLLATELVRKLSLNFAKRTLLKYRILHCFVLDGCYCKGYIKPVV